MLRALKGQRGDTLVEVLIAIVVVSMILVAAYVTTTRNIDGMQDTEEHSEAVQLAQSQLEYLHDSNMQPPPNSCFKADDTITNMANCQVTASGSVGPGEPQFQISINPVGVSPVQPTYEVSVTWDSLVNTQTGKDNVSFYYQP